MIFYRNHRAESIRRHIAAVHLNLRVDRQPLYTGWTPGHLGHHRREMYRSRQHEISAAPRLAVAPFDQIIHSGSYRALDPDMKSAHGVGQKFIAPVKIIDRCHKCRSTYRLPVIGIRIIRHIIIIVIRPRCVAGDGGTCPVGRIEMYGSALIGKVEIFDYSTRDDSAFAGSFILYAPQAVPAILLAYARPVLERPGRNIRPTHDRRRDDNGP